MNKQNKKINVKAIFIGQGILQSQMWWWGEVEGI